MKSPILENPGSTPQVLPGLLVGEQMKTPGTDEELKKTHRRRRPKAVRTTTPTSRKPANLLVHRVDEYWGNPGSTGSEGAAR